MATTNRQMTSPLVGSVRRRSSVEERSEQRLRVARATAEPVPRIGPIQAALAKVEADGGQESEAGFRALAEEAPCAIFIVQGTEIPFANRAAREITGYSIDDLEHCALWDVVHPDDRERARRLVADMYTSSAPSRHEVKLVRKNGQP